MTKKRKSDAAAATVTPKAAKTTPQFAKKEKREDKGDRGAAKPKVPPEEWKALHLVKAPPAGSKRCKFFNLSCGCSMDKCNYNHVCWQCGGPHKWVDKHFRAHFRA